MIVERAGLSDIIDNNRRRQTAHMPALRYKRIIALVLGGDAWVARETNGETVGVGGLYTAPDGTYREGWLWLEGDQRRSLLAVVKAARAVIADAGGPPVIVRTQRFNERGERLVRLLGFRPSGEIIEGASVWRLHVEGDRGVVRRRQRHEAAAGDDGAANGGYRRGETQGEGGRGRAGAGA